MGEDLSLSRSMSVRRGTAVCVVLGLCLWAPLQGTCDSVSVKVHLHGLRGPRHLSHTGWLLILTCIDEPSSVL